MEKISKAATQVKETLLGEDQGPMTRFTGCPVAHNKNSLTAGPHGPVLLQDIHLFEKMAHFAREKTPARNVHALGCGAYGTFTATNDISEYSNADVFKVGKKTDLFARMSGIFTEQGEPDTTRDGRGFAMKMYTDEGNWDLMTINTPVFPLRDMKVGPDQIHSYKRDPRHGMWNPTSLWDFAINHPESMHQVMMLYTDRGGTPLSFRGMHTWACNTFSLTNQRGERFWCKFHCVSTLGAQGLDQIQAKMVAGEDPNFMSRDLWENIEKGNYPQWKLKIQIMKEEEGYRNAFAFDPTKVWSHKDFPLIDVGTIELNRNPVDYFSEVEQVAFSPANIVPGIGFSPDKLLQGRLFIYDDTQRHRIGANFKLLPVNAPHCPVRTNYSLEGPMNYTIKNRVPHYYPSEKGGPQPDEKYFDPPYRCDGPADYYDYPKSGSWEDLYSQPAEFWRILDSKQKEHLTDNIAMSWIHVEDESLLPKVLEHFRKINQDFAATCERKHKGLKDGSLPKDNARKLVEQLRMSLNGMSASQ